MRDSEGIFIGAHLCRHWQGVAEYKTEECCGGRKVKFAYVRCGKAGVLRAESRCCSSCFDLKEMSVSEYNASGRLCPGI